MRNRSEWHTGGEDTSQVKAAEGNKKRPKGWRGKEGSKARKGIRRRRLREGTPLFGPRPTCHISLH